jgi:hypothetical protein
MKALIFCTILIISANFLAGCRGLSYDEQDAQDGIRQDLVGFILGLEE